MSEAREKIQKYLRLTEWMKSKDDAFVFEAGDKEDPRTDYVRVTVGDLRALLAERTWHPIETAPKDVPVLLWWPARFANPLVGWNYHGWRPIQSGAGPLEGPPPTHWMPLPPPPEPV